MKQGGRLNAEFDKLCVLILSYLKINIDFLYFQLCITAFFSVWLRQNCRIWWKQQSHPKWPKCLYKCLHKIVYHRQNHGQTFEQSSLFKFPQITFQDTCKFDGEPRVFYKGPHFKISSFHPDRIRVLSPQKNMPVNLLLLYCIYCRTDKMSCSIILGLTHHAGPMTYSTNVLLC